MAEVRTPRVGRAPSASRGVTVAASQKSKPKHAPFKFLRKDEGRLSYACQLESPVSGSANHNSGNHGGPSSEQSGSRSLRQAIASDMRKGKNQDPFAGIVVAVPKRAPPPNPAARDETEVLVDAEPAHDSRSVQSQPPRPTQQQTARRHERGVDAEGQESNNGDVVVTTRSRPHPRSSEEPDGSTELIEHQVNTSSSHIISRRDGDQENVEWQSSTPQRWRGNDTMMSNGASHRSVPCRYVDPTDQEDYARSSQNFFRRSQRPQCRPLREEDNLVEKLEEELRAAKEEREWYHQLKVQLDRDRQRFDDYRSVVERQMEEERAELDATRMSAVRQAKDDIKVVEERYKSTLELLKTGREANKKLTQENELLRQQLEGMTTRMREAQKLQKAETSRLRREIESLTRRNEELLEMTREQQIAALESTSGLPFSSPVLKITSGARPQLPSSIASGRQDSEDSRGLLEECPQIGKSVAHQRLEMEKEKERKRLEAEREKEERRRLEMEREKEERRRLEMEREKEERRRLEMEKERKRLEMEREKEERRRLEIERERERKRLEVEKEEQKSSGSQQTQAKSQELRSERRSAGHPINTPRAQNVGSRGVLSQRRASLLSSTPSVGRRRQRAPTAQELIADEEPTPVEDFPNDSVVSQTTLGENSKKREVLYRSGKREIHYANGTRKVILPSGHVVLYFTNGDIKHTFPSGKSSYWYAAAQTTHMQYTDGVQVFQFHSSGQVERHLPDGKKEILYPDGIYKVVFADGRDETIFPDEV